MRDLEKNREIQKRSYWKNREKRLERMRAWQKDNKEKLYASQKKYRETYPWVLNEKNARRRASILMRTPKWLSEDQKKEILDIYSIAKDFSWLSEGGLEVDHIMPLVGKKSCGLHVPWNLQIIPAGMNARKSNKEVQFA